MRLDQKIRKEENKSYDNKGYLKDVIDYHKVLAKIFLIGKILKGVRRMKTLSVRGLWGYLIASGVKDVENRTTLKNIRGWHLIHVSKNYDNVEDLQKPYNIFLESGAVREKSIVECMRDGIETGAIIGAMYIKGCETNHESPWAESNVYNLLLDTSKAILFDKPIEGVGGKLSVWDYQLTEEYLRRYPQLLED